VESQLPHSLHHSAERRAQPRWSRAREQHPGTDADRQDAEQLWQLAVVNEPRTSGADLERADRRHASAAPATLAVRLRSPFRVGRLVARDLLPSPSQATSATYTGAKPERDLRDGDHGQVAMPNGLMVDVTNAEVSLEELCDRLDRRGSG